MDSNGDGRIDALDTPGAQAVGFSLADLEFALVIASERETAERVLDAPQAWTDIAQAGSTLVASAAGAEGGLWISRDAGNTWSATGAPTGLDYRAV